MARTAAEEIKARLAGQDKAESLFDSDIPAIAGTNRNNPGDPSTDNFPADNSKSTPDTVEDITPEKWVAKTIQALDQTKELITERFLWIEKQACDLNQRTIDITNTSEEKLAELLKVEAVFHRYVSDELPGVIEKNFMATAQGLLNAKLELIANDITVLVHNRITDEFNPLLKKMDDTTVNLRLAAADVEAKTGGVKQFLRTAGIATVVAVVLFVGLKIYFGLGVDAEYGRQTRMAISKLNPTSRTTIESIIKGK
jgi:hypothetical protein